jgi:molybdate transport system ATP-binding protein
MIDVDVKFKVGTLSLDVAFANSAGITALFGQSGSGKSVTLNLIAGLMRPDQGYIRLDGVPLVETEKGIFLPMHRRRIGLVFQDSNLFPHLSVKQNLLYGRWFAPSRERRIDFDAVVETLGIRKLLARAPARLSGGERQRVAIGRALLSCPKLLLFDEPLAALDMRRKLEIMPLIERIRDEFKVPIVYVSHSIQEVTRLASCVVIIDAGRVKSIGDPSEAFGTMQGQTTDNRFNRSSVLTTTVRSENAAVGLTELKHPAGTIWIVGPAGPIGSRARIVVKATDVVLSRAAPRDLSTRSVLSGRIAKIRFEGPLATIEIALEGEGHLLAMATKGALDELELALGAQVFAAFKTTALDEGSVASAPPQAP